jgi:hypothetical protein
MPIAMLGLGLAIAGCGTRVPSIEEVWEPVAVGDDLKRKIRTKIFCETIDAIRAAQKIPYRDNPNSRPVPALPDNFGVQIQTTITIDENLALNPSVGFQHVMSNANVSGVNVARSIVANASGTISSTATRIDTQYSYYIVGKIAGKERGHEVNTWCKNPVQTGDLTGSSPLLIADLGITDYLMKAVYSAAEIPSSKVKVTGGAAKTAKLDIFSYQIKFVVVTSGGINPVIKLANVATGFGNQAILATGRTRTHELILTFGPGDESGPIQAATSAHYFQQLNSSRPLQ